MSSCCIYKLGEVNRNELDILRLIRILLSIRSHYNIFLIKKWKSKLFLENNTIKDISNILFKKFKNNILLENLEKNIIKALIHTVLMMFNYVDIYSNYFKKVNINRKDRVAIIVGNIPEFFILKIALNYNEFHVSR